MNTKQLYVLGLPLIVLTLVIWQSRVGPRETHRSQEKIEQASAEGGANQASKKSPHASLGRNAAAAPRGAAAHVAVDPVNRLQPEVVKDRDDRIDAFSDWIATNREAIRSARKIPLSAKLLEEGRRLAEARRPAMVEQIRRNPRLALQQSVTWALRRDLPAPIQALIEKPFSEMAKYERRSDCRPKGKRDEPIQLRFMRLRDGDRHDAHVYGRRRDVISKDGTPLQGITLDGQAALWDSAAQPLTGDDLAAARAVLEEGNPGNRAWLSGAEIAKGGGVAALIGGKIYHFADAAELGTVTQTLAAAEALPGPSTVAAALARSAGEGPDGRPQFDPDEAMAGAIVAQSMWTETSKNLLALRVVYSGQATSSHPYPDASGHAVLSAAFASGSSAIESMSFDKTDLSYSIPPILTLPHPQSYYENPANGDGIANLESDANAAAAAATLDLGGFDFISYWTPPTNSDDFPGVGGAFAYLGMKQSFFNSLQGAGGDRTASASTHEFGHNYGLIHANSWYTYTGGLRAHDPAWFDPTRDGYRSGENSLEHEEYGDIFDIMGPDFRIDQGGDAIFPKGHFSMSKKSHLNWIESGDIWEVASSGIFRIHRFDHIDSRAVDGNRLAARIDVQGNDIWVGLRRNFLNNPNIATGAYVIWDDSPGAGRLIDTTPLSNGSWDLTDDRQDAVISGGSSWTDPSGTVRLTNLGFGGTSPNEYIDLRVTYLKPEPGVDLYTDASKTTPGLTGSYVNSSLIFGPDEDDWRNAQNITIAGTRTDTNVDFPSNGWGARAPLGLTDGTDDNWDFFSVQWDGVLTVSKPTKLATTSNNGSRMWIDIDQNGSFGSGAPELIDNEWGTIRADSARTGPFSQILAPGDYPVRIQFEEGFGDNSFQLTLEDEGSEYVRLAVFTDAACTTAGLTGSYVDQSLAAFPLQDDWRSSPSVTISGTRTDLYPGFLRDGSFTSGWGVRSTVGLTSGTDEDWDEFSVQWDGYIKVNRTIDLATVSEDGSRMWVDLNDDGSYGSGPPEYVDNNWVFLQPTTLGPKRNVPPGKYRIRIQYAAGTGDNAFLLAGAPDATIAPTGDGSRVWQFGGNLGEGHVPAVGSSLSANGFVPIYQTTGIGIGKSSVLDLPGLSFSQTLALVNATGPNGGGGASDTNQWTIIVDVNFDGGLSPYQSVIQTSDANNNDEDAWISPSGQLYFGGGIVTDAGAILPNTWYRLAFTCGNDGAGGSLSCKAFINGAQTTIGGVPQTRTQSFDGRYSLDPIVNLFSDDTGDTQDMLVNSVAFWGRTLSDSEVAAFGGPVPTGIPVVTKTVTTLADSGFGSLRDAVEGAVVDGQRILFDPSLDGGTIKLNSQLTVREDMVIDTNGLADGITLDAQGLSRVIEVTDGLYGPAGAGTELTLRKLNVTGGDSGSSRGGGILVAADSKLFADACTIHDNRTDTSGGGIQNFGTLTLINSTIANNRALSSGGGIDAEAGSEEVFLGHCTVAGNQVDGFAGGIRTSISIDILNTIIADNRIAPGSTADDVWGDISQLGGNIVMAHPTGSPIGSGTISTADPQLGSLSNNGGPTLTMLPGAAGPAIDAALTTTLTTDQRGSARVFGSAPDIGSVEVDISRSPSTPDGQPWSINALVEAEDFDIGIGVATYSDTGPGSNGIDYRPGTDVDVEVTTDVGGGHNIGWIVAGEWTEYTVDVPEDGRYVLLARVASNGAGATFRVEFDGVDHTGPVSFGGTGGWQNWITVEIPFVELQAGVQIMRVHWVTGGANLNWIRIDEEPPELLSLVRYTNGRHDVTWASKPGRLYRVEYSTDLQTWIVVDDNIPAAGASTTWLVDRGASQYRIFFRVAYDDIGT